MRTSQASCHAYHRRWRTASTNWLVSCSLASVMLRRSFWMSTKARRMKTLITCPARRTRIPDREAGPRMCQSSTMDRRKPSGLVSKASNSQKRCATSYTSLRMRFRIFPVDAGPLPGAGLFGFGGSLSYFLVRKHAMIHLNLVFWDPLLSGGSLLSSLLSSFASVEDVSQCSGSASSFSESKVLGKVKSFRRRVFA